MNPLDSSTRNASSRNQLLSLNPYVRIITRKRFGKRDTDVCQEGSRHGGYKRLKVQDELQVKGASHKSSESTTGGTPDFHVKQGSNISDSVVSVDELDASTRAASRSSALFSDRVYTPYRDRSTPVGIFQAPKISGPLFYRSQPDLLEELTQARAKFKHAEEQLAESKARETVLQDERSKLAATAEQLQKELQVTLSELEDSKDHIRQLESDKAFDHRQHSKVVADLDGEKERNRRLSMEAKNLRDAARLLPEPTPSLGPPNKLDQVSEAHVKSDGQVSIGNINDALDYVVVLLLEEATALADEHRGHADPFTPATPDEPLFSALGQPGITEDKRGLLLDALLHDTIVQQLHQFFFQSNLSTSPSDQRPLERLFDEISNSEPWVVSQQWRAITAANLSRSLDPSCWDDSIAGRAQLIVKVLAWAYHLPLSVFGNLAQSTNTELTRIYRAAHELSLVIKRDVLSVRLSVTAAPTNSGDYLPFDPHRSSSVWPEMGAKSGDQVIGNYKLGLMKCTETGDIFHLILPEVITVALIREVGEASDI